MVEGRSSQLKPVSRGLKRITLVLDQHVSVVPVGFWIKGTPRRRGLRLGGGSLLHVDTRQ